MSVYLGDKLISGATYIAQETIDKKAETDLSNLTDTGKSVIDGRISEIMSTSKVGELMTSGISKASNGYVKFANGIIIQWGNNAVTTVTLPTPFTSTNYKVAHTQSVGSHTTNTAVTAKTTTTFTFGYGYVSDWIAVGY